MGTGSLHQAQDDFAKARIKARFDIFVSALQMKRTDLLSLYDVKELLKPKTETYIGVKPIEIKKIVGSEGRYQDFNRTFLPKKEMLRTRWQSIDRAHMQYVDLPPISVYKIGDSYFVRDGNHRVSVAKTRGIEFIDASIVELGSEITPEPGMSMYKLRKMVINYERKRFLEEYPQFQEAEIGKIRFSAPGRYTEMLHHIEVHKYYINETGVWDMDFTASASSWYENVYLPIIREIRLEKILTKFPGRTEGDMYMWIIRYWEELRKKYGEEMTVSRAARDLTEKYGKSFLDRLRERIAYIFSKKV